MQALFAYPEQALYGRVLPKSKIYTHGNPGTRVRALFVSQVNQIVWRHKLSSETLRLAARSGVSEIQVFEISLKTPQLDGEVLRCIDKAIPFPIIFELTHADRVRIIAAYKRPNESDSGKWVLGDYHATPWHAAAAVRAPLPVALDLGGLYDQMLRALVGQPARRGESLKDQLQRLADAKGLQAAYKKLEQKLRGEKQFNRKVEINAEMRSMKKNISALIATDDRK